MRKINPRQQDFADYFIELGNAEEAALRAGYSKAYARGQSYKLLANVGIKTYIENRMEELKSERVADQQEILESLTKVLRGEAKGTALVGVGMGEQEVKDIKPTLAEKIKAAELLGRRFGMWTDKVKHEGAVPIVIEDDVSE
ncbi:terminase small subunit [Lysinibacillus capsici]|uniref:terminase small subunit n=1 Tax=Lysinibacillus capsici TaxID=2115968 RepID=UPI003F24352B